MEPGELRQEACDAAVASFLLTEHPTEATALVHMHRYAPDLVLSKAHRAELTKRLDAALEGVAGVAAAERERNPVVRATNLVYFLPWLDDPALTERYARTEDVPWPVGWMGAVLETGHPVANRLAREWFENPEDKDGRAMLGGLADHVTEDWLPAMRRWLARNERSAPTHGDANVLRAIGTSPAIALLRDTCIQVIERGQAPNLQTTAIWLAIDPEASDHIKNRIKALKPEVRVALLGAMGGSGVPGMLGPVSSYLGVRGSSDRLRCETYRALGQVLTRVHGQEPERRKAALARVRDLLRADAHVRRCLPEGLRFAGRQLPSDFEAVLVESLQWGARDGVSDTYYLIRMLGRFGRKASLEALKPFCAYPRKSSSPRYYGAWHLTARQAVGAIEARLANPAKPIMLPGAAPDRGWRRSTLGPASADSLGLPRLPGEPPRFLLLREPSHTTPVPRLRWES